MDKCAYASLLYNDDYGPGALVVGHTIKKYCGQDIDRVILVTRKVSPLLRTELAKVYTRIVDVDAKHGDAASTNFRLLNRPELLQSLTKVHLWNLDYDKVIYLDADILLLANINSLFDLIEPRQDTIVAAPDIGWPDIFNSGVFCCAPNNHTYTQLCQRAGDAANSFDGGDQGLLNQYFLPNGRWTRIPFTFNVTYSSSYQYMPAYNYFRDEVKVVHFIGSTKPWQGNVANMDMAAQWRAEFRSHYGNEFPWEKPRHLQQYTDITSKTDTTPAAEHTLSADAKDDSGPVSESSAGPPPQYTQSYDVHNIIQPSADHWDATKHVPPMETRPEAEALTLEHYSNAWDRARAQQPSPVFRFPQYGDQRATSYMGPTPSRVERVFPEDLSFANQVHDQNHDIQYYQPKGAPPPLNALTGSGKGALQQGYTFPPASSTGTPPSNATPPFKPVFPWETQPRPPVERVYPEDHPTGRPKPVPRAVGSSIGGSLGGNKGRLRRKLEEQARSSGSPSSLSSIATSIKHREQPSLAPVRKNSLNSTDNPKPQSPGDVESLNRMFPGIKIEPDKGIQLQNVKEPSRSSIPGRQQSRSRNGQGWSSSSSQDEDDDEFGYGGAENGQSVWDPAKRLDELATSSVDFISRGFSGGTSPQDEVPPFKTHSGENSEQLHTESTSREQSHHHHHHHHHHRHRRDRSGSGGSGASSDKIDLSKKPLRSILKNSPSKKN